MRVVKSLAIVLSAVSLLAAWPADAGKLRRFERGATKPKVPPKPTGAASPGIVVAPMPMIVEPCGTWAYWRCGNGWWGDLRRREYRPPREDESPPVAFTRAPGDYLLPELRAETNFQSLGDGVRALDIRADVGYRTADMVLRYTLFDDKPNAERMHLLYAQALMRVVPDAHLQWDLGVGVLNLKGESLATGLNVTTALTIVPQSYIAAHFQPTWSLVQGDQGMHLLQDYDFRFAYTWPYVSAQTGYRWLVVPNDQDINRSFSLSGPYFGVAARW